VNFLQSHLSQQALTNTLYGVSACERGPGYFKTCVGKLSPDGSLYPVKRYNMILSGSTAMGEDWYLKDFCLYIDDDDKGRVSTGNPVVVRFHDRHLVYPDMLRCTPETGLTGFNSPAFTDACVFGNRVFGILGNTLYASALGDETKWDDFQNADGSPKESGSFTVQIDEPFTAIAPFMDHVAVFTQNKLYLLYGSRPGNFTLTPVLELGVRVHRELTIRQDSLYFVSGGKLWHYAGGRAKDLLYDLQIDVSHINWLLADHEGLYLGSRRGIDYYDGRYTTLYEDDCTGLFVFDKRYFAKIDMDMVELFAGEEDYFSATCTPPLSCGNALRVIICARGDVQIFAGDKLLSRESSRTSSQRQGYLSVKNGELPDITVLGGAGSALYGICFEAYGGNKHVSFTQR